MVLWKISGAGTCAEWKAVETVAAKRNYKSSEQFWLFIKGELPQVTVNSLTLPLALGTGTRPEYQVVGTVIGGMTLCWSIEFNPVWPLVDKSFSLVCKCNAALRQVVALLRSSPSLSHWIVMRTPFWNQHFVLWFHQFLYQSHWLSLRRHRLFYLVLDMYGLVWHEPFQWLCSGVMRS